jgi:hypothetical protein
MKTLTYTAKTLIILSIVFLGIQGCKKDNFKEGNLQESTLMATGKGSPNVHVSTLVANSGRASCVAADKNGYLYLAQGTAVLKISATGKVSTFAGSTTQDGFVNGTGTAARFSELKGIVVASDGTIYVADAYNNVIRKITSKGVVSTYAGCGKQGYIDGARKQARFDAPWELAIGPDGSLYVYDNGNYRIRKITSSGVVSTVAGANPGMWAQDGPVSKATFDGVTGMAVGADGAIYVVEHLPSNIRMIKDGVVKTIAGAPLDGSGTWDGNWDGLGSKARFSLPQDMVIAADGHLYIADAETHMIRRVSKTSKGWMVKTIAGDPLPEEAYIDGPGNIARFYYPHGITFHNGCLYVSETGHIRKITFPANN